VVAGAAVLAIAGTALMLRAADVATAADAHHSTRGET